MRSISDTLRRALVEYIEGTCLENLLRARVEGDGWFIAAPGYAPYGNFVWHRDNAECVMALDEYAATFGDTRLFEITEKALLRSFLYVESKAKGVQRLAELHTKLANPEFYKDSYHPHARLTHYGDEIPGAWHNVQYDSVARLVIALSKHVSLRPSPKLLDRCRPGLRVALRYLFDAIWEETDSWRCLTVCANEWEEKDEPHLRGPLFSSVVGLLHSSSRFYQNSLQRFVDMKDIDLKEFDRHTESMMRGFFVRESTIRMIKRYEEPPRGMCASALWLLTTFEEFPANGEVFNKTIDSLIRNRNLNVALDPRGNGACGLRRYELVTRDYEWIEESDYVDRYWGGQAWVITTAQLATALAMKGCLDTASNLLECCLRTRDGDGKLPEQFDGTFHDRAHFDEWRQITRSARAAPWLAWSHAEVLRAYTAIYRAS